MLAAGSPAPFNSTDWIGLRSMASASASRRRASCALEFAEKTSASNSTGNDNDDDVPCRCDSFAACGKVYRTRVAFNGAKWRMQSGQMRWLANYNNVLTLGVSQQSLYLASMFLFQFMHPPLLVPWSEIKMRRKKGWVFEYVI